MTGVSLAVALGLLCALLSALGTNLAFLLKYKGAVAAPAVDMRHPLRSAADLFRSKWWSIGWGVAAVAFALLFLPTYIAVKLVARAIGGKARRSVLGPLDRVLGGGFGMVKGFIGATLLFLLANFGADIVYGSRAPRPEWMTASRTYQLLDASGRSIVSWIERRRHPGVTL